MARGKGWHTGASGKICSERKERGNQRDCQGLRAKFTGGRKCAKKTPSRSAKATASKRRQKNYHP